MNIGRSIATLFTALSLWGCTDTSSGINSGAGHLSITVKIDPTVTVFSSDSQAQIDTSVPESSDLSLRITELKGSHTHLWKSVADYTDDVPLSPGPYHIEAYYGNAASEGFDCPHFYSSAIVDVISSGTVTKAMECKLANTMLKLTYDTSFSERFPGSYITLHSEGGSYIDYPIDETRPTFMKPGNISVTVNLKADDSEISRFQIAGIQHARACYYYQLTISANETEDGTPQIVVSFDEGTEADDITVTLTSEFINSEAPVMSETGFSSNSILEVTEGVTQTEPLVSTVKVDGAPLQSLILTTYAPELTAKGWPEEINLLNADEALLDSLSSMGLKWTDMTRMTTEGGNIDFTDVIPRLRVDINTVERMFALRAINSASKASLPSILHISLKPIGLTLVSVSHAVVGINETELIFNCPNGILEENFEIRTRTATGEWTHARIISLTHIDNDCYSICCEVPDGTADVGLRIYYCGLLRGEYQISRVSPQYTIETDAFALKAILRIKADDERITSIVTSRLSVFDGTTRLSIADRDPEKGTLCITGLSPAKNYSLNATVMNSVQNTQSNVPLYFSTEGTGTIPNSDFEDFKSDIKYKDMPSGGRYSQTQMVIFNRQNHTSFDLSVPERWANTNAKTFCTAALNHNTWYLQPSVVTTTESISGSYGVILTSVAWDTHGEEIANYVQQNVPFTAYSCNVPHISYRAAAKLFLGTYRFNSSTLEETYREGISFNCRPASLNGYYSYLPGEDMPNDCGYARIEILGKIDGEERVIASGTKRLEPATGHTAFSIPLTYDLFGVKATGIKVFFSSSCEFGDISHETESIVTTPDVTTSTSTGSRLWLDGINLSY